MTNAALDYARQNRQRFLDELEELLAIPSVSTLPNHQPDMQRAARWLCDRMADIGLEARIIPGDGHPLVFAEWLGAGGAPTILLYGHYDVQPVDPLAEWTSPPFQPSIRDGNIYARGASDDKGQIMTMVDAAESLLTSEGKLPVNLKFVFEGEEECGGEVVSQYVTDHVSELRADIAQVADGAMFAAGVPTLESGLRGIVYTEVRARGASHDLHSGQYGGVAPNPFNALAHVISSLKSEDGTINIPGIYERVHMPPQDVLDSWQKLPFSADELKQELGVSGLIGEPGYTPLERMWARPTLDVHGIAGGFVGEGAKTVIPAEAVAKISMRIVPDQNAKHVFALFRKRVLELTPPGIELNVSFIHGDDPVVVDVDNRFIQAARKVLQETFHAPAVLARTGGSIPIVGKFKNVLGMDTVLMGWGLPDDNLHAPNEKLSLDNFYGGIDTTIRFWQALA
ncbi:MAG: dipeptidase [Chloroflexota bacterium]